MASIAARAASRAISASLSPNKVAGAARLNSLRPASTAAAGGGGGGAVTQDFPRHAKEYVDDGYTIIRNAIDKDLVGEMSEHLDYIARKYPGIPSEHWHHLIMRNDPFWVRVVSDPRLMDIAAGVAPFLDREHIALFSSHYFLKPAKTGMAVLLHQDGSYWALDPMNVVTLWVAVDSSDSGNGCLHVVKGTHRDDFSPLKEDKSVKNVLGSATHTYDEIDRSKLVDLVLNPGDVSIHHPNIVHGSNANTSDRRRCGLTIRYIAPTTQCTDPEQPVLLLRGKAVPGINEYRSWPPYRPGYDMPFRGADKWNEKRYVNAADDKAFFGRDSAVIEEEIKKGLWSFIDQLGGR